MNPFSGIHGSIGNTFYPDVAELETARPPDGESVTAIGFPLGSMALINTSGSIAASFDRRVLETARRNGINIESEDYRVDLRINPGNSGGPLFRVRTHGVLGVIVEVESALGSTGGIGTVVPANYIANMLSIAHIDWIPVSSSSGKSK